MDTTLLKTLLHSQNEAIQGTVGIFMKQMNDNLKSMESTISELRRSLEFTQKDMEDMKQEVKKYKEEKRNNQEIIEKLNEDLQSSKQKIKELEGRINYQEDYSRRKNLQIIGIEEQHEETWEQTAVQVTKLLEDKLQLPNVQLERAHRVGRQDDHRFRPIIARFTRFGDREAVMRNATKLRGSKIYINEDLCPASQTIRNAQIPQLKQARSEGKIAYFRHTRLIIKDRTTSTGASGFTQEVEASTSSDGPKREKAGSSGAVVTEEGGTGVRATPSTDVHMDISSAGVWASKASSTGDSSPALKKDRRTSDTSQRTTRHSMRGGRKGQ